MKKIFSWYRKVYSRYTTCENCIRLLPKAIFLILLSLAILFWHCDTSYAKRQPKTAPPQTAEVADRIPEEEVLPPIPPEEMAPPIEPPREEAVAAREETGPRLLGPIIEEGGVIAPMGGPDTLTLGSRIAEIGGTYRYGASFKQYEKAYQVRFQDSRLNRLLVYIFQDDAHYLEMIYLDEQGEKINVQSMLRDEGIVFYPEPNMEIKYLLTKRGVKEEIVFLSAPKTNTLQFALELKGFTVSPPGPNGYAFFNSDTGEELLRMEALTMVDASGKVGRADITIDTQKKILSIEIDKQFLNTATYPVTLDPTVIVTGVGSYSSGYNNSRKMVKDSSGNLWVVYERYISSYYQICCAKSIDNGDTWTETQVTTDNYHKYYPAIAIDSANNLHVVWNGYSSASAGYYQIGYVKYTAATTSWGTPSDLTSENYHQYYPSIAVDSSNNLHVVWHGPHSGSTTYYQIRYLKYTAASSSWDASPTNLTSEASEYQYYACIVVDPSNNLHVVWHGQHSGSTTYDQIRYIKYTAGGTWGSVENRTTDTSYYQYRPSIAADSANNLHLVWYGYYLNSYGSQIRYLKYTAGVGWDASPTEVTNQTLDGGSGSDSVYQYEASVACDSSDNIHVLWRGDYKSAGTTYYGQARYRKCTAAGTWDASVTNLSQTTYTPSFFNNHYYPNLRWSYWPDISGSKVNIPDASGRLDFDYVKEYDYYLRYAYVKLGGANVAPGLSLYRIDEQTSYTTYPHSEGIVINYDLADPEASTCKVKVEYSTDNSIWNLATLSSTNSDGTIDNGAADNYRQTNLSSTVLGGSVYVEWNSVTDLGATYTDSSVWIRLTPNDGTVAGTTVTSSSFEINNPLIGTGVSYSATAYNNGRKMVRDSSGYLHAVYYKTVRGYSQIFYSKSTDSGANWAETQLTDSTLNGGAYSQSNPAICVDSSNNLHVVWYGPDSSSTTYYQIRYRKYTAGGSWDASITNLTSEASEYQYIPSIAVDSSNNLHVVWYGQHSGSTTYNQIRYLKYTVGVGWDGTVTNLTSEASEHQYTPSIAVDSSNNLHVVWYGQHSGSTTNDQIRYIKYTAGGTWGSVVNVSTDTSYYQAYPSICVDSSDNLHVVWYGRSSSSTTYYQIRYKKCTAAGTWDSSATELTTTSLVGGYQYNPSIAGDTSDNLHVVWRGIFGSGSYQLGYKKYTAGVGWQTDITKLTASSTYQYYPNLRWSRWPTGNVDIPATNEVPYVWVDTSDYTVRYRKLSGSLNKVSTTTGNFSAAATWQSVDQSNPSIAGNTLTVNSSTSRQIAFTPSAAHNCAGAVLHLVGWGATGIDITVTLQENTGTWVDRASAVISTTNFDGASPCGWIYWKFATPYAVTAASNTWRFNITSSSATSSTLDTSDNTNLSYLEVTDTTAAPEAGEDVYVVANGTISGTYNQVTVTVDINQSTTVYGDIEIGPGATLSFSPTATTYLVVGGDINVRGKNSALAVGTTGTPIGASYTAILELMSGGEGLNGIIVGQGGILYAQGSSTYHLANPDYTATTTSGAISAGTNSLTTAVATGWQAGDIIVVGATANGATNIHYQCDLRIISSVVGTTVTTTSNFSYAHASGARVLHLSRNAKIRSVSASYKGYIYVNSYTYTYGLDADYAEFRYIGATAYTSTKDCIYIYNIDKSGSHAFFDHCSVYEGGYYLVYWSYCDTPTMTINHLNLYNGKTYDLRIYGCDSASFSFTNVYCLGSVDRGLHIEYNCPVTFTDSEFIGNNGYGIYQLYGASLILTNCKVYSNRYAGVLLYAASSGSKYTGCTFGSPGTNATADILMDIYFSHLLLENCLLASTTEFSGTPASGSWIRSYDHDQTSGKCLEWQAYGKIEKSGTAQSDTTKRSGDYALKFSPTSSTSALSLALKIAVANGQKVTAIIWMRKNSTYGSSNLPSITLSGCGLTGTASMTDTNDTWVQVAITANNLPTSSGVAALTISTQSAGASAAAYFDDLEIRGVQIVDTGTLDFWGDGLPPESLYKAFAE